MLRRIAVAFLCATIVMGGARGVCAADRQVLLVQNSGWMEPFYLDGQSQFIPMVQAFAAATAAWGGEYAVATFNQSGQLSDRTSPDLIYSGQALPNQVSAAVAQIGLPKRSDGKYTDADFLGALVGTMSDILGNGPGVVWMVTNNKNSPNNSQEVTRNTRGFFQKLRQSDGVSRIVSFPIRMRVSGPRYSERGLIIYGIGLGEEGARTLARLEASEAVRNLISDPAVLLKPLHQAPLAFELTSIQPEGAKAEYTDGMLRIHGLSGDKPQEIVLRGHIVSGYYPHVIRRANLKSGWGAVTGAENLFDSTRVIISPAALENVMPSTPYGGIEIRFQVPAVPRPEGLAGLFVGSRQVIGALDMDLHALKLEFAPEFEAKMNEITAMDQLPDLFFDNRKIEHAKAVIPVGVQLSYSVWPMIAAMAALVLLGGGGIGMYFAFLPRNFPVNVNGRTMQVRLRPFESTVIQEPISGKAFQVRRAGFGRPSVQAG